MINSSPVAYEEFMTYLEKLFKVTTNDIKVIVRDFHAEMQKGLSGYDSSLKMIPSFVDRPKGNEKGRFIALDLGGTNFRVLAVELDGKGKSKVTAVSKFAIKKKDMQGEGKQLFDFIADCIGDFLNENNIDRKKRYDLAFTFSFPVEQTNIAAGKLIVWTKGFTAKGVEGEDVIVLLNEALKRKSIKCIRVAALANDTVGTLVAKSYTDKNCDIGVILGTGTNACYPEKLANIQKWRGMKPEGYMIINMEWGNFNKLNQIYYDKALDEASPNPGAQFLEKMVSGMYLGELTRLIICDMIQRNLIFCDALQPIFMKEGSLGTEHMSLIEADTTTNLGEIEEFLTDNGIKSIRLHDKVVLKRLCHLVSARAAKVAAAGIAAVLTWMDPELIKKHSVGIDGTLYEKYPGFKDKMTSVFKEIYPEKSSSFDLVLAKDGSGMGAAVIAAVAAQSET
jgi:hexokinase